MYNWQDRFAYASITTNVGAMCCALMLRRLRHHWAMAIFQLYYYLWDHHHLCGLSPTKHCSALPNYSYYDNWYKSFSATVLPCVQNKL